MPETSPAAALAAALLALALLLAPGWLMLRLVRVRGLLALALAPACSTAVLGSGAILAQLVGVRWSLLAAVAATAVGMALALLVRRLAPRAPDAPRLPGTDGWLIAVGVLLAVVPTLATVTSQGSLDAYLQRWDAVFHLAALRLVEESGSASSLTLGALSYGDGRAAVYPAGWHALGSLLPGSPTAALTIGATVTSALPWVLGCAALAVELARPPAARGYRAPAVDAREPDPVSRRSLELGAAGVAGLLAGLVTATPMSLWAGWGHVPNAAALAMLPGVLALGLRLVRDPRGRTVGSVAVAVALLGLALTHPNAALAAAVLMLPAVLGALGRTVRTHLTRPSQAGPPDAHAPRPESDGAVVPDARTRTRGPLGSVLVLAAVATAILAVLAFFLFSPLAASVTGYTPGQTEPLGSALAAVVVGQTRLWPTAAGVVVALLALVGAVTGPVQHRGLPATMLLLTWVLYVDAATGGHLQLSRLWYTSPARLSVVVAVVAVPLAAGTLVAAAQYVRARVSARSAAPAVGQRPPKTRAWTLTYRRGTGMDAGVPLRLIALALVVALAVPSITGRTFRTANVFQGAPGHPPQFVTTGELEMIADLPDAIDGTILGSPFSGASSAYGLVGVPVVFPVAGQVWSDDQRLIMESLEQLSSGEMTDAVCAAVERLEVRYLYQDTEPYQADPRYQALDLLEPAGARVIAEGDTARVLELAPCRS